MRAPLRGARARRTHFLPFGAPAIGEPEIREVVATLRGGWLGTGPRTQAFEEAFRSYQRVRFAVATNSCTAALHLALEVAGIGPGDDVLVPALTFAATANVVVHAGARPVFVDVDPRTMTILPEEVAARRTRQTKAVMPVHFAGRPVEMDELAEVASGLVVIGDAAHCIEGRYHGRTAGQLGDLAAFSFYPTKNMTTGDGGMLVTDNEEWAERARVHGLHGLSRDAWRRYARNGDPHYDVVAPGHKYNMTDLAAALGLHQLARIEENLAWRQEIWKRYDEALAPVPGLILPPPPGAGTRHARHLYTVLVDPAVWRGGRDGLAGALREENIGTGVHFPCLPQTSFYRTYSGAEPGDYPNAEFVASRTLSLPLASSMDEEDVEDVVAAVWRCAEALVR